MIRMRIVRLGCAVALAGMAGGAASAMELRFSSWDPPTHEMRTHGLHLWALQVEAATAGRVTVKLLPKPVGAPPAHHDLLLQGAIDVCNVIPDYTPGRFVTHEMAAFPTLTRNAEASSVAHWRVYKAMFEKAGENDGLKLLTIFHHGPGLIHTTKKQVTSMADLNGVKLRVPGQMIGALAKSMGATPIFAPITSAYELLSKGTAEGLFLTYEGIKNFRLESLVRFTNAPPGGLYTTTFETVMNQKAWDKIAKEDQAAIMSVSGEPMARLMGRAFDLADVNGIAAMKAAGITVTPMSDAFKADIEKHAAPLMDAWFDKVKAKGIDGRAALAMYKAELAKTN